MKRTVIYILMSLYGILTAQSIETSDSKATDTGEISYMPVLEVGKTWTYQTYCNADICPVETFRVKAVGTIREDGKDIYLLEWLDTDFELTVKAYEDDGIVYMDYSEYCMYVPLINFNLEVGDITEERGTIISKEYVVIEGIERCLITIERPKGLCYWCEGIGAIGDNFMTAMTRQVGGHGCTMTECWMDDRCLYNEASLGGNNSDMAVSAEEAENRTIYDMLGRRISTPVPGHMYIRNGKKYIVKIGL